MRIIETDFLIIGSGIAGLSTALWAAPYGNVIIITKDEPKICNSSLAQGGIAAAVGKDDSPKLHTEDTLNAGAGICRRDTVNLLTKEAPMVIETLINLGTQFDLSDSGEPALAREGAHSLARVLHHGDDTGAEIWQTLYRNVLDTKGITVMSFTTALDLIIHEGRCIGATAYHPEDNLQFIAKGVILATGGSGQIYGKTTNSPLSTGDGLALAWRAGAMITDMEFIQFHPTALNSEEKPLFLISEAVRGEGAVLRNSAGKTFMKSYHPLGDLAPRDIVSRAITSEQQKGHAVFLDASSIGSKFQDRFPNIFRKLKELGIDPQTNLIPVTPAAHFTIGGVKTNHLGKTNIPGLFACGEAANTGVHGANRLASNSLLEGLVFSRRIASALAQMDSPQTTNVNISVPEDFIPLDFNDSRVGYLQELMWSNVGIIRDEKSLSYAYQMLTLLEKKINPVEAELMNMLQTAKLIAFSALKRPESRGTHFRRDFPEINQSWQKKHISPRRYTA